MTLFWKETHFNIIIEWNSKENSLVQSKKKQMKLGRIVRTTSVEVSERLEIESWVRVYLGIFYSIAESDLRA